MRHSRGAPVLDTEHLARQTLGDRDLERELLELFERQCRSLIPLILGPGPDPARAEATHTLRGGALAVGATRLAAVTDDLEATLLDGARGQDLRPLLSVLRAAATELEREIAAWQQRTGRPGLAKPDPLA